MNRTNDETARAERIVDRWATTRALLLQYDEDKLVTPKRVHPANQVLDYEKAERDSAILKSDRTKRDAPGDLISREREHQLQGIYGNCLQDMGIDTPFQTPSKETL